MSSLSIEQIDDLNGDFHRRLRDIFEERRENNDRGLREAWINKHSWRHMDAVAGGTYQLGMALGLDWHEVLAVTLAARSHDIGYHFPPGVDASTLGKKAHAEHARLGADLFVSTLKEHFQYKKGRSSRLPRWWHPQHHTALADMAIRYHSNDSAIANIRRTPTVALLTRLIDKLDITEKRVDSAHIQSLAAATNFKVNHLVYQVQDKLAFGEQNGHRPPNVHKVAEEEVFQRLRAFQHSFVHRIVPYAISDQVLHFHPRAGTLEMTYAVHPSEVGARLGIRYTPEQFLEHFDEAYARSMGNAAAVMRLIRMRIFRQMDEEGQPHLRVRFSFEKGQQAFRNYIAKPNVQAVGMK